MEYWSGNKVFPNEERIQLGLTIAQIIFTTELISAAIRHFP